MLARASEPAYDPTSATAAPNTVSSASRRQPESPSRAIVVAEVAYFRSSQLA